MALELKDVQDLLGIEITSEDTVDTVKEKLHKDWAPVKMVTTDERFVKPIVGKALGSITTSLQRSFKATGIELSDEELKDKKVEDIIDLGFGKVGGKIKELDEKSKAGNDAKLKKAEEALQEWEKKYGELENLHGTTRQKLEETEKNMAGTIKEFKLTHKLTEAEGKLAYSETADELKKLGFKTKLSQKYSHDLDEHGNVVVLDKVKNERVKNEKGTDWATWDEVLAREAKLENLLKQNDANRNSGGYSRPIPTGQNNNRNNNGGGKEEFVNFIHPDALAG